MRIMCLEPTLCIRAWKEMYALKEKGFEIYLVHADPYFENCMYDLTIFNSINKLPTPRSPVRRALEKNYGGISQRIPVLASMAKKFADYYYIDRYSNDLRKLVLKDKIDIIHSHNAPDFLSLAAIRSNSAPVVHDTHDTLTAGGAKFNLVGSEQDIIYETEKQVNERSHGRVYCSNQMMEYAKARYDVPEKNNVVFPNYANKRDIPDKKLPKLSASDANVHLVYEGSIGVRVPDDEYELFEYLAQKGYQVHMHLIARKEELLVPYRELAGKYGNIHYHEKVKPSEIILSLTQYDAGLLPFPSSVPKALADIVLPNKLYDYTSAGLPVIALESNAIKEFLSEHWIGENYSSFDEIPEAINRIQNKEHELNPREHTVENNIHKIIELYNSILQEWGK